MASPTITFRAPAALVARIDSAAERSGQTRTEWLLDLIEAGCTMDEGGAQVAAPKAAGKPATAREALRQAEARAAHLAEPPARTQPAGASRLDTSFVPVFDGGKRLPYQKGTGAKAKR